MTFEPGDVVVVRFPFTNHEAAKQRPAVKVEKLAAHPMLQRENCLSRMSS